MTDQFKIEYLDKGRPPKVAPNPKYPDGVHADLSGGKRPACTVELPYMVHKNVGYWYVECIKCHTNCLITMASRPDDPRSVVLPCKQALH
jgi:hypothetical protein